MLNTLSFGAPHVGEWDNGWSKPPTFFFWCPWPVWIGKTGKAFYQSRRRYHTREAAEKALAKYLQAAMVPTDGQ